MQNVDSSPLKWPKDVGILAMEIYVPRTAVSQTALGMPPFFHPSLSSSLCVWSSFHLIFPFQLFSLCLGALEEQNAMMLALRVFPMLCRCCTCLLW